MEPFVTPQIQVNVLKQTPVTMELVLMVGEHPAAAFKTQIVMIKMRVPVTPVTQRRIVA